MNRAIDRPKEQKQEVEVTGNRDELAANLMRARDVIGFKMPTTLEKEAEDEEEARWGTTGRGVRGAGLGAQKGPAVTREENAIGFVWEAVGLLSLLTFAGEVLVCVYQWMVG